MFEVLSSCGNSAFSACQSHCRANMIYAVDAGEKPQEWGDTRRRASTGRPIQDILDHGLCRHKDILSEHNSHNCASFMMNAFGRKESPQLVWIKWRSEQRTRLGLEVLLYNWSNTRTSTFCFTEKVLLYLHLESVASIMAPPWEAKWFRKVLRNSPEATLLWHSMSLWSILKS